MVKGDSLFLKTLSDICIVLLGMPVLDISDFSVSEVDLPVNQYSIVCEI